MSRRDRAVTRWVQCWVWLVRRSLVWAVPAGRREWTEAVLAEAPEVPGPRQISWLMGGWWIVIRQAGAVRRVVYGLGIVALAVGASAMVSLVWRGASVAPGLRSISVPTITMNAGIYVAPGTAGDVRSLAVTTVIVLAALPWVARRRGAFGPVGDSWAARVVRVAGCAALGVLVLVLARLAQTLGEDLVAGGGLAAAIVTSLTIIFVVGVRLLVRGGQDAAQAELPALLVLGFAVPLLLLIAGMSSGGDMSGLMAAYAAGFFAVTARGSRIAPATLGSGAVAGAAGGLIWYVAERTGSPWHILAVGVAVLTAPTVAGAVAAWRIPRRDDPKAQESDRLRQSIAAGGLAGGVGALVTTIFIFGTMVVLHRQDPARMTEAYLLLLWAAPVFGMMLGIIGGSVPAPRQPASAQPASAQPASAPPGPLAPEPAPDA